MAQAARYCGSSGDGAGSFCLFDKPTNHLDLAGIEMAGRVCLQHGFAAVVISHDRYFLENVATEVAELNRIYAGGLLRVGGNYSAFLARKGEFLQAQMQAAGITRQSGADRDRVAAARPESAGDESESSHRSGA